MRLIAHPRRFPPTISAWQTLKPRIGLMVCRAKDLLEQLEASLSKRREVLPGRDPRSDRGRRVCPHSLCLQGFPATAKALFPAYRSARCPAICLGKPDHWGQVTVKDLRDWL